MLRLLRNMKVSTKLITVLAASLPFAIAGFVGILGVGLVNDDMASHLIIADYVSDYTGAVPSFIKGGYPIGPHAIVAAIARVGGADLIDVFAGFTMALAPLFGLLAVALLGRMGRLRLIAGASLVALTYLGAAYLTHGAFKEPLQAMLLIGFALSLAGLIGMRTPLDETGTAGPPRSVHPIRRVLPAAVIAAAASLPFPPRTASDASAPPVRMATRGAANSISLMSLKTPPPNARSDTIRTNARLQAARTRNARTSPFRCARYRPATASGG